MKPKIAFISIQKSAHSETFIDAQRRLLSGEIVSLWGMGRESEEGLILTSKFKTLTEALVAFFKKNQITVVFAQFGLTGANVVEACRTINLPLVVHFYGFDAYDKKILHEYKGKYNELFSYAAFIVAVSKDMVGQLKELGALPEKLIYAPCGGNDIFFSCQPRFENKTFVTVGRFVAKKAPHLSLSAFRKVLKEIPDCRLIMIGIGSPLLEVCMDLAYSWGIIDNVDFLGIQSQAEVRKIFEDAFCFVQHSVTALIDGDSEGTPVAIIEASAAGLPVISTKHMGIKDVVIHGKTGYLVEERDVDTMASFMLSLIRDERTARKMGLKGRDHIRNNFTMEQYISKLDDVICRASNHR